MGRHMGYLLNEVLVGNRVIERVYDVMDYDETMVQIDEAQDTVLGDLNH